MKQMNNELCLHSEPTETKRMGKVLIWPRYYFSMMAFHPLVSDEANRVCDNLHIFSL